MFYKKLNKTFIVALCLSGLLIAPTHSIASVTELATEVSTYQNSLTPFTATYKASIKGLSATLTRTLSNKEDGLWQLQNNASIFLATIKESSLLKVNQHRVEPLSYNYKNPLSSKKNSALQFDWQMKNVRDTNDRSAKPLPLKNNSYDKLSFQMQLRMDLMQKGKAYNNKTYHLVDKNRLKTYNVERLGEEQVTTPAGKFTAVKLKQFRPGKNKHTLIWLAKDWQYIILKLERFEDGKSENSLELQEAVINGKPLTTSNS